VPDSRPAESASKRSGKPTGRVDAVIDDPRLVPAVVDALTAAGFARHALTVMEGTEGANRLDATGAVGGMSARVKRIVSFTLADQMPDLILYEAALREGRAMISVAIRNDAEKQLARSILAAKGAHFINYYGRFVTEELTLWRGPEPKLPGMLRR
jgi:hypothetical protein